MKKIFIGVLVFFLAAVALVYVVVPAEVKVSTVSVIRANEYAVFRHLINEGNWKKWWPSNSSLTTEKNLDGFYLNGYVFKTGAKQLDRIEVIITRKDQSASSLMNWSAMSPDSIIMSWTTTLATSSNPISKINNYFEAKKLKQSMEQVVSNLKTFAEKKESLYGLHVIQTKVTDTILLVTKTVIKEAPTDAQVYSYIAMLRKYIAANKASETNFPMLNIGYSKERKSYEVMVAIAVNKKLPGNNVIALKRMVAGNILYAEITGGQHTVKEGIRQMEQYVSDHQKISPALPFQLLVTDRIKEKDTAKWVTRIYYPIL